jgi:hypothetical protein
MAARKTHKLVDSFEGLTLDRNAMPNDPRIDEIVSGYMKELRIRSKDRDCMPWWGRNGPPGQEHRPP